MDETHIILLLAVLAVLVLAVAVVILLPKEKIAPASSDEEKNKRKSKQPQKKKSKASISALPPSQKSMRIKGFSDVQDVEDTRDLEEYLRIKDKPTILANKEEKKAKPQKPTSEVRNVALEDDVGEEYIKIKRERENKKKANSNEEKQEEKKKRKKPFFKPEIVQGMIEGRKKDREERKNKEGTETVEGEDDKKKKKNTKSEEPGKKEEPNVEGQPKTDDKKSKKERPPKTDKGEQPQQQQQRKERPPRTDSPRPPRPPGAPRAPAPIRNSGLEPASLDAMLSAITHFYAEAPNVFKKLDKEIIVRLLQFLPLKDIITLTKVNKHFRAFIKKEESLWAALCARDFSINKKLPNSKSFKHTYKVSYQNAHNKK